MRKPERGYRQSRANASACPSLREAGQDARLHFVHGAVGHVAGVDLECQKTTKTAPAPPFWNLRKERSNRVE